MAEWTKLSSESTSSTQANDEEDDKDSLTLFPTNPKLHHDSSTNSSFIKRRLTRQRSLDSPKPDGDDQEKSFVSVVTRPLARRGEDLENILSSDENLNKLGISNSDFCNDEATGIIDRTDEGIPELGSQIRKEAKEELENQAPHRRPVSLYGSLKIKNMILEKDNCLIHEEIRNGGEKLMANGKVHQESTDKHVHRVQFNRDARRNCLEPPKNSLSMWASSSTSSSDDNTSCGHLSEARPPDGGWGWVIVAASFMVNLIADGIVFSFGILYTEFLHYFGEGKAKTSWIGSLFMAMPLLSGPVASFLTDRYGCRKVTIAGSFLATLGFVLSSFANSVEVLLLTFGVLAGFGLSLCFVAAVVIVAYYFDKKRSFATGLSVCGSGIGTFIFAPVTDYLVREYGWRGTTLILAGFFLNLAVCGCLMRDLEWTTLRAKELTKERRRIRERKRLAHQSSSGDSFSGSSSANTATQTLQSLDHKNHALSIENTKVPEIHNEGKLFSSLVNLPTFVKNDEKIPVEVLELLNAKKGVYNVLLQNYPNLLVSSRSLSESSGLHETSNTPSAKFVPIPSPLADAKNIENAPTATTATTTGKNSKPRVSLVKNPRVRKCSAQVVTPPTWCIKKASPVSHSRHPGGPEGQIRKLPTAYLRDIRIHRHSLTYRGAMLNINRYRLRASSCPDIYRNSMTTIAKTKMTWYSGLWEFWDLIVDMLDFSHFTDKRFLLFAISNFLLHAWYDVPYMYIADNAIEMGFDSEQSSYVVSIIGIMNMCGEVSKV